jgi:uncharacterized protein YegJ (DUF2314 family)
VQSLSTYPVELWVNIMSDVLSKPTILSVFCSALLLGVSALSSGAIAAGDDAPSDNSERSNIEAAAPAGAAAKFPELDSKADVKAENKSANALPTSEPDYYSKRAQKTVNEAVNGKIRQHPIQDQFPDQNIVVCEAGCPSGKTGQIMFMEAKAARKPRPTSAEMIPAAAGLGGTATGLDVACEAGCYGDGTPKTYSSLPGAASNLALKGMTATSPAGNSATWVTTVAKADADAPKNSGGSGDWMKRIDTDKVGKKATPAADVKPATTVADAKPAALAADTKPATIAADAIPAAGTMNTPVVAGAETAPIAPTPAADPTPVVAAATPAPTTPSADMPAASAVEAPAVKDTPAQTADVAAPAKEDVAVVADTPEVEVKIAEAAPATTAPSEIATPQAIKDAATPAAVVADPAIAAPAPDAAAAIEPAAANVPDMDIATNSDAANEGSDLKNAGAMAAALDQAKATADEAKALTDSAAPVADASASDAVKPTSGPEAPKIVSGPEPTPEVVVDAANDKPVQVAATTPDETPAPTSPVKGSSSDAVINVESSDTEMNAAISKARASLPEFWTKLDAPATAESDFSLKVAIEGTGSGEVEHFWLTDIMRKDGKIVGVISNDPETVKSVKRGQSYEINPEKISDWLYKRNGKMVGNETMRPLLKRLPAQQAAAYRSMYETP